MITGYNTDIEHDGVVYHVQTEDKGLATPIIMSLIYDRGTILASKRVSYEDLINGSLDEEALAERLQRQHKLLCAAVSAGRIEDLKQMSARNLKYAGEKSKDPENKEKRKEKAGLSAKMPEGEEQIHQTAQPESEPEIVARNDQDQWPEADPQVFSDTAEPVGPTREEFAEPAPIWPGSSFDADVSIPDTIPYFRLDQDLPQFSPDISPIIKPTDVPLPSAKPAPQAAVPVVEDISIIADEPVMVPIEAVEAVSDFAGLDRPENTKLNIDIIGNTRFKGGEEKEVCVMVCRGSSRKVVSRAEVMIKVLGSDFRPMVYHSITDRNGMATVNVKIPQFNSGRASLIARAISEGEEVEIRSAVAHG